MTNYDGHLSSYPNVAAGPFELNTSLGMRLSVLVRDDEAVENLGDILQNFPYLKVRGLRYRIQSMPIISGVTSGGQLDGVMTKGDIITSVKVQLKGKRARHVKISDFKDLIKVLQDRKRIGEEEGYEYFLSIEIRSWVLDSGGDDCESNDEVSSDEESSASDGGIRPGVASPDSNSDSEFEHDDSSGVALQESASMYLTGDDIGKGSSRDGRMM